MDNQQDYRDPSRHTREVHGSRVEEIAFLREQVKALRRLAHATERQIDHCETRIDDLQAIVARTAKEHTK